MNWIELIKGLVQPFVIVWGWIIYGVCILSGIEVPAFLIGILGTITVGYGGVESYSRIMKARGH